MTGIICCFINGINDYNGTLKIAVSNSFSIYLFWIYFIVTSHLGKDPRISELRYSSNSTF
jgi:hypothetical protein